MKYLKVTIFFTFSIILYYLGISVNYNNEINYSVNQSIPIETTILSFSDYDTTISRNFANYSYNFNGICGSISASIILQYYDDYLDDSILPINCENNEINTLNRIMPYIDHIDNFNEQGGSNVYDMYNGLNSYMSDYNVTSKTFSYETYNTNTFKSCINSNIPVIIDLDNHPIYGEHWVVGYGYYTNQRKVTHVICIDGWGNEYVQIPISYIGFIVF